MCLWCRRTGGRAVGRGWSLLFAVRPCTVPRASKEVTMFTSTHNLPLSSYYEKFFIFCCLESRDHNRTERESKGVGRDILISQKLFLELCGPRGKQFPVNSLTSGRLAFTIQSPKARRSQQMKKSGGLSEGTMWRDFQSINCPTSTKEPTIETG